MAIKAALQIHLAYMQTDRLRWSEGMEGNKYLRTISLSVRRDRNGVGLNWYVP